MKLIPPVVYRFNSNAEKKIFDAMRKADSDPTVIVHSLNLPEHEYKQWAEADFVAVSSAGVMVIEVKGGRVACEDGIWLFTDRYGQVHRKSEGPFEQAKTARIALERLLRKKIDGALVDRINFGAGLMFPDIRFDVSTLEIPKEAVFDANDWSRREIGGWLRQLASYWSDRTGRKNILSPEDVRLIAQAMRPTFDLVPALVQRVGSTMEQLIQLTDVQYRYLDILVLQKRVVIEGGAGTGKTLLAAEAARRLSDAGKSVCFLCRSPVLAWHVRRRLEGTNVKVLSYEDLKAKPVAFGAGIDVFVIDEGQDFLSVDVISHLDSMIKGGFLEGSWLFFMDKNNQGGIYEAIDQDALDYIKSAGIPFPLADNCRNTYQIAVHTMMYTGGDIGACSAMGEGLKVEESRPWKTKQEELDLVEAQLEKWVDKEGVSPHEITIISLSTQASSVVSGLSKRWRRKAHRVDESFGSVWLEGSLTFSTACDFKGLENRYIMLVDLDEMTDSSASLSSLYVGMTRANASLWISVPDTHRKLLDRLVSSNALKLADYVAKEGKKNG